MYILLADMYTWLSAGKTCENNLIAYQQDQWKKGNPERWTPWPRPDFTLLNYLDSYLGTWHGPWYDLISRTRRGAGQAGWPYKCLLKFDEQEAIIMWAESEKNGDGNLIKKGSAFHIPNSAFNSPCPPGVKTI